MGILSNRSHEAFAQLVASGVNASAAYSKVYPSSNSVSNLAGKLSRKQEIVQRVAEIQIEVASQMPMQLAKKRDLLRQMIDGKIPTKVIKKSDGKVEAHFDRLAALMMDSKLSGDLVPERAEIALENATLTFEIHPRGWDGPVPKSFLEAEIIEVQTGDPNTVPGEIDYSVLTAPTDKGDMEDIIEQTDL